MEMIIINSSCSFITTTFAIITAHPSKGCKTQLIKSLDADSERHISLSTMMKTMMMMVMMTLMMMMMRMRLMPRTANHKVTDMCGYGERIRGTAHQLMMQL